jgi:hypothetical protein
LRLLAAMMGSVEPELVVRHPPLTPEFGIYPVAVVFMAPLLVVFTTACAWLLFLAVNQLLVLAGWGWGNLILIQHETRWLPVAGCALAWFVLTWLFLWLTPRMALHWTRRIRRTWWVRLTSKGFEVNDRIFTPSRYAWREINQFMLVAPRSQIRVAVVTPPKTFIEALKAGYGVRPVLNVGFECTTGRRALALRLFGSPVATNGTRADGVIVGRWDRHLLEVVDLFNDWLALYREAA